MEMKTSMLLSNIDLKLTDDKFKKLLSNSQLNCMLQCTVMLKQ